MMLTGKFDAAIHDALSLFGIEYSWYESGVFLIDRTAMVTVAGGGQPWREDTAYERVLALVRSECDTSVLVYWSNQTDDWMSLSVRTK